MMYISAESPLSILEIDYDSTIFNEGIMYEIIYNPCSRSNVKSSVCDTVSNLLEQKNIEYRLHKTKNAGHAETIAHDITSDGKSHNIIVIGGDGTLNEVLNGLCDPDLVTMGLIPSGSGNDFARAVGLPTAPTKALDIILNCNKTIPINYGEAFLPNNYRRFLISCGCGFDSDVCRDAQVSPLKPILNKLHMGKLIYTFIALKKLIRKSTFSALITIDDDVHVELDKLFFITAMNTSYEGGGYMFCPNASPSDDKLDFLTVNNMSRLRMIPLLPKAKKGAHVGHKGIDIIPISTLNMKFSKSVYLHTDGEVLGAFDHVKIACSTKHINFYLPDMSNEFGADTNTTS